MKNLNKNEFGMDTMRNYLLIVIFLFYTLPVVFIFMGAQGAMFSEMQLLALNPIIVFMVTIIYTVKVGINWKFPLIVAGVFLPTIFIFYNLTGIVYAITYGVISFIGLALGAVVRRYLN